MSEPAGDDRIVYPQLLRTPTYRVWKPVVGVVVLLLAVFVAASVVLTPVLMVAVWVQSRILDTDFVHALDTAARLKTVSPASLLWLNLTLASGVLLAWAVVRVVHGVRPRWLTSVRPGIRWRFFWACVPISIVAMAVQVVLGSLVPAGDTGDQGAQSGSLNHLGGQALAFALVIVLTTPLQAMGEEYVFRGYLTQAIGSLFGTWNRLAAAVTLVATAVLFALFHGGQNPPLFFDRFAFGLLAAYLVLRVGGLEPGIALHVVNNFVAYGSSLLFGDITSIFTVDSTSYWAAPVTVVQSLVFLGLVLWVAKRMGLDGTTSRRAVSGPSAISAGRT